MIEVALPAFGAEGGSIINIGSLPLQSSLGYVDAESRGRTTLKTEQHMSVRHVEFPQERSVSRVGVQVLQ
jgi:hypothetical protein